MTHQRSSCTLKLCSDLLLYILHIYKECALVFIFIHLYSLKGPPHTHKLMLCAFTAVSMAAKHLQSRRLSTTIHILDSFCCRGHLGEHLIKESIISPACLLIHLSQRRE